jgi:hypothetical protein
MLLLGRFCSGVRKGNCEDKKARVLLSQNINLFWFYICQKLPHLILNYRSIFHADPKKKI